LPGAFVSAAKYIIITAPRGALPEFARYAWLDAAVTLSSLFCPPDHDPAAIARTYDQQCRLAPTSPAAGASVPTGFSGGLLLAMQIARALAEPIVYRIAQAIARRWRHPHRADRVATAAGA
jgi:hypothetical protein